MSAYWRVLETEIVRIARARGYEIDEVRGTGDKIIVMPYGTDDINLTEFAKELAQALGMQS